MWTTDYLQFPFISKIYTPLQSGRLTETSFQTRLISNLRSRNRENHQTLCNNLRRVDTNHNLDYRVSTTREKPFIPNIILLYGYEMKGVRPWKNFTSVWDLGCEWPRARGSMYLPGPSRMRFHGKCLIEEGSLSINPLRITMITDYLNGNRN